MSAPAQPIAYESRPREDPRAARTPPAEEPYRFNGHSGAHIALVRREGGYVVRKTAASADKNERLLAQAERQRQFFFSGIPVPRIFATGLDAEGLAFFEMEYVPGRTVANIVSEGGPLDPEPVTTALARLFDFLRLTAAGTVPPEAFQDKIAHISASGTKAAGDYREPIARIGAQLSRLDWRGIPQSHGHGDLTLENILVGSERGVVFIDCDECFASSYWLDAAKLFQDIDGHWCLRGLYASSGRSDLVNAIQQMHALSRPLRALAAAIDYALPERLAQLSAFHLFRTLPYVREASVAGFVLSRLEKVLSS